MRVIRFYKSGLYKSLAFLLTFLLIANLFLWLGPGSEEVYAKDGNGDIVVVIDPGHGAYDGGARSPITGDDECTLNWNIAKYMKAELETYAGVRVYVTRASNEWNTNAGRALMGKALGADAVISIHNNSSENGDVKGFVAYGSIVEGYVEPTKNLCLNMARYIQATGLEAYGGGYLTRPGGNPAEDYYTIIDEGIKAGIPTIIAEHSFMTNASDANFMHDTENQRKVGVADATAVAEYFGLSKRTVSDGQSVELDRSYSAYFIPANQREGAISFASSDENVAHVRSDGLITAVNAGTATITYTYADGTSGSCTFTTKPVVQVAVSAGINPTVYRTSEQIAAIDRSRIIVKAIYSDGTCRQQTSGYTVGDIDPYYEGRQYVSISHNGFTGSLMIRLDKTADTGSYSEYLYQIKGDYSDIFTFPELVSLAGVSGSPYTSNGFENTERPTQPETTTAEPVTETTTETTAAETTTAVEGTTAGTTEAAPAADGSGGTEGASAAGSETEDMVQSGEGNPSPGEDSGTGETTKSASASESGRDSTENMTTASDRSDRSDGNKSDYEESAGEKGSSNNKEKKPMDWIIAVLIVLIVLMVACIVLASISIRKNNRYNRRLEQRERRRREESGAASPAPGYVGEKKKGSRPRKPINDEEPKRRKH